MLFDLDLLSKNTKFKQYDVCICGAGPAGITVARTLAANGKRVALLEGGSLTYTEDSQRLYEGKSVGVNYWDALKTCRLRFFGGTSNHWTGLCSFFDESDFENRSQALPGWPISRSDVHKYFDRAKEILDLPKNAFQDTVAWSGSDFKTFSNAQSPPTRFNGKYLEELKKSENIDLYINANLTNVHLDAGHTIVDYLEVTNNKNIVFSVTAKQFTLALGTVENARMLLACNKQIKAGIGNQGDMVGRCFMEHLNITYGRFVVDNATYWKNGRVLLQPSPAIIKKLKIGNGVIAFDSNAKTKSYGRLRALKQYLRNLVCSSDTATELARKIQDFPCDGDGFITSMIEQSPNPDSRITLDKVTDRFGIPKVILTWNINKLDMHTIRTIGLTAAKEMAKLGAARVLLPDYILDENVSIKEVGSHCHQMGTTRMSSDPKYGVVDGNSKVHGISNLFMAGSSVFSTGGGCNPTFTVTMLSLRLGEHLSSL